MTEILFRRSWHWQFAPVVLIALLFALAFEQPARGQSTSLNVTNFGAVGDAVQILVTTVSNSPVVTFPATHPASSADIGKIVLLFGVGPATTPTNNQDLIATIVSVASATSVTISRAASVTAANVPCTYGTQNAGPFQSCINASSGTNALIKIPAGNYLLVPPSQLNSSLFSIGDWYWRAALVITNGGLTFEGLGATRSNVVLTGCGAWSLVGGNVMRGVIFLNLGPISHDAPMMWTNLTMDGGVQTGRTDFNSDGPANPIDGSGWDVTHDAVLDAGNNPLHAYKAFINCSFVHWRGEMVKSTASYDAGMILTSNCSFIDGEGSGYNFNWTPFHITGCLFSNLNLAIEHYVGTMRHPFLFENSTIAVVRGGFSISGALSNSVVQTNTIRSNSVSFDTFGVVMAPCQNLAIVGNQFLNGQFGIETDSAAYQGSVWNSNILVMGNSFNAVYTPIQNGGGGVDSLANVQVVSNYSLGCWKFAFGYGWGTNVLFLGNRSQPTNSYAACLRSEQLVGQYFIDDPSNDFPPEVSGDDSNGTQPVELTYTHGMRHEVGTSSTNSLFVLDDTSPFQIPIGVGMWVSNISVHPVRVGPSAVNPNNPAFLLAPGQIATFYWTNGSWSLPQGVSFPVIPGPPPAPTDLRLISTPAP